MTHFLKLSYHSCLLSLLNSGEENETNSYVILIVAMNALISCNFEKKRLGSFQGCQGKRRPLGQKGRNLGPKYTFFQSISFN